MCKVIRMKVVFEGYKKLRIINHLRVSTLVFVYWQRIFMNC